LSAGAASFRLRCAGVLAVVTPLGFATKLYTGPGAAWIGSGAGGLLYVVFWIFVVLALFPRLSPGRIALAVFAATSALELLQLWQPTFLAPTRASFLGHALLGSTFAWSDFPYYAAGALAAWALARRLARQDPGGSSSHGVGPTR
jgi:hypothetical protein